MQMQFRLFIQQHHHGAFTARVLSVPSISAYAEMRAAALKDAQEQLAEHVRNLDRRAWGKLAFEEQQLHALALEVKPKGKGPQQAIPITVNLLITNTQVSRNASYLVVTAPRIEGFHVVVNDPAQLDEQARAALAHYMRKWSSAEIVLAEQPAAHKPPLHELPGNARWPVGGVGRIDNMTGRCLRSEEHTSELQSL